MDREVLAQRGQRNSGSRGLEVLRRTAEVGGVREHAEARRSPARVVSGERRWVEITEQVALGRGAPLDLGDHRQPGGNEGVAKAARRRPGESPLAQLTEITGVGRGLRPVLGNDVIQVRGHDA